MEFLDMLEESKSQPETYAPSSESLRLIARPIPFAAPVTINFCPSSSNPMVFTMKYLEPIAEYASQQQPSHRPGW